MDRKRIIEKLHARTGAAKARLEALPEETLHGHFRRSVSPQVVRFQYNAGLGLIGMGSFFCMVMSNGPLAASMLLAAISIAEVLDKKRGRNKEIGDAILRQNPPEI
jgi:hypothetical protein